MRVGLRVESADGPASCDLPSPGISLARFSISLAWFALAFCFFCIRALLLSNRAVCEPDRNIRCPSQANAAGNLNLKNQTLATSSITEPAGPHKKPDQPAMGRERGARKLRMKSMLGRSRTSRSPSKKEVDHRDIEDIEGSHPESLCVHASNIGLRSDGEERGLPRLECNDALRKRGCLLSNGARARRAGGRKARRYGAENRWRTEGKRRERPSIDG